MSFSMQQKITEEFCRSYNFPDEIKRPPVLCCLLLAPAEWKQKLGCRSGLLVRLPQTPLLSMYITNARSLIHKMDELEVLMEGNCQIPGCCVSIISEPWLHQLIPEAAIQLEGRTMQCWDRNEDSGKSRGGSLCIHVHNK